MFCYKITHLLNFGCCSPLHCLLHLLAMFTAIDSSSSELTFSVDRCLTIRLQRVPSASTIGGKSPSSSRRWRTSLDRCWSGRTSLDRCCSGRTSLDRCLVLPDQQRSRRGGENQPRPLLGRREPASTAAVRGEYLTEGSSEAADTPSGSPCQRLQHTGRPLTTTPERRRHRSRHDERYDRH